MMVAGSQWFWISLISGEMETGLVAGHTSAGAPSVSEPEARALLLERVQSAGFKIEQRERPTLAR
jgi:hypothetical protein